MYLRYFVANIGFDIKMRADPLKNKKYKYLKLGIMQS